MKVYVITNGIYSDYHICGVATDYETAEKIRAYTSNRYDESQIEEYDTDIWTDIMKNGYMYYVSATDGVIDYVRRTSGSECNDAYIRKNSVENYVGPFSNVNIHTVYVIAKSEDHAKKIASDLFAKYEAEKNGL